MKVLESAVKYLSEVKAPTSTLEIASRLLEQAEMTHMIGMAILEQAEGFEGQKQSKRRDDGLKMLRASKAAFMEAAKLIAPFEEVDRQKALIDYAIESGYQLAYEIGKKIHFERTDCLGNRYPVPIPAIEMSEN
jgi:hypothetical protein